MVGFHQDDASEWVADLSCLHTQHVRHQPPFRLAPWVLEEAGRADRVGSALDCPLCDRAELPADLSVIRTTALWDERTMPAGLRRSHRVAAGVWGRLVVREGQLRFRAHTRPPVDVGVGPGAVQPIPPEVEHEVEPLGEVCFLIEFLKR